MAIAERNVLTAPPSKRGAVKFASRILQAYPRDAANVEGVMAAIAAQFELYPESVCEVITDLRNGLVSKLKFIPSAAEVREALEAEHERRRVILVRAEMARKSAEIRAKFPQYFTDEDAS